jgi:hypothetical protein
MNEQELKDEIKSIKKYIRERRAEIRTQVYLKEKASEYLKVLIEVPKKAEENKKEMGK